MAKQHTKTPTRIVEEPTRIRPKGVKGNVYVVYIRCNDGKRYLMQDLCKLKGIPYKCLYQRLYSHNYWTDENILAPPAPKGRRINGMNNSRTPNISEGNAEWNSMNG